jgi:hypothetical protein
MRQLTLQGFLRQYLKELSHSGTCAPLKLTRELPNNARLLEPLSMFVAIGQTEAQRQRICATCPKIADEFRYRSFLSFDTERMTTHISSHTEENDPYHKVLTSYAARRNKTDADNHTKALMRTKILELQKQKHITTYRICKDLCLNPGNVTAFLNHANDSKLSLTATRRILNYLREIQ